jgi:starch phosphorylase
VVSCQKSEDLIENKNESGKVYNIKYEVDVKGLGDAIGIELVTIHTSKDGKDHIYSVEPLEVTKKEGDIYTYEVNHSLNNAGSFKVAYRMFPKNVALPHRQDFCYVRWFN